MHQFRDQMLADIFDRGQSLSFGDVVSELVQEATEIHQVWSSPHGWAPIAAADLLSKSRLDWQVSLTKCLAGWTTATTAEESDGRLILAWANLGALVEGTLKWFLSIFYEDYRTDVEAIRRRGSLQDPDVLTLEPLRNFFRLRVWTDHERIDWDDWIQHVQQRRNAIHSYASRPIGDWNEFQMDVRVYLVLLKVLNWRVPAPEFDNGELGDEEY
jgi:hypothetical protein